MFQISLPLPNLNMLISNIQFSKILLSFNSDLKSAVKNLQKSSLQIILVVDKNKKLLGTITDGDIRRGLLKGFNLSTPVTKVLRKNFFSISNKIPDSDARELMLKKIFCTYL